MVREVGCLVVFALSTSAWAGAPVDAEAVSKAKTHFRAGKAFYELEQYDEAIREFAAGYATVPRPEFLLNLGQAYRRTGATAKAAEMFEKYLTLAPTNAPERAQVKEMLAALKVELANAKPAPDAPVATSAPVLAPSVLTAPPVEATPAVGQAATASSLRQWWWAIPLGVAVIAGATVGVWAATRPAPDPCAGAAGLGCLDLRGH